MSLSPSIEIHRNPIFIIPINNTLGYIRVLTYIYICYIMIQWSSKSFNQEIPARCLGSGDESCIPKVAREVPLFEDPLCAMGVPWRFDCLGRKAGEKWIPMDSDSFFPVGLRQKTWSKWWWPHRSRAKWSFNKPHLQKTHTPPSCLQQFSRWIDFRCGSGHLKMPWKKEALRGIFLSANKPYNEMMDSNAILPDGKMHGARGPEGSGFRGENYTSCTSIPVCILIRFHVHVYNFI